MRAVHAEWTKLCTVPSTAWLALAAVTLTVLVSVGAVESVHTDLCPSPSDCGEDTTRLSLSGVYLGQLAVVVLAVLAMTSEYGTRTIHTTLSSSPRRLAVLAAKAAVVLVTVTGAGLLGVLGSLAAGRVILPTNGFTSANGYPPLSLADEPTLRAAGGTVLYLALLAVLSLGVGALVRHTAGAITAVLALLFVAPVVAAFVTDPEWAEWVQKAAPMTAGLAIQATERLYALPIGPWAGLGVMAAWAGGAVVLGAVAFAVRDA